MQTRPLSKCMLLACAYQRTRQRKMGIAKKYCQGFGRLFGKGGLFGRPFFKTNPQELSTLCIYPENSWTTQRMRQSKNTIYHKFCPRFLSYNLGGTSHEQPWPWSCSVLENVQWTLGINPRSTTFCTPGRCDFWGCDTIKVNRLEP